MVPWLPQMVSEVVPWGPSGPMGPPSGPMGIPWTPKVSLWGHQGVHPNGIFKKCTVLNISHGDPKWSHGCPKWSPNVFKGHPQRVKTQV